MYLQGRGVKFDQGGPSAPSKWTTGLFNTILLKSSSFDLHVQTRTGGEGVSLKSLDIVLQLLIWKKSEATSGMESVGLRLDYKV